MLNLEAGELLEHLAHTLVQLEAQCRLAPTKLFLGRLALQVQLHSDGGLLVNGIAVLVIYHSIGELRYGQPRSRWPCKLGRKNQQIKQIFVVYILDISN